MAPDRSVGAPRRPDQAHRLPRNHQAGDSRSHREPPHGQHGSGQCTAGTPYPRPPGRLRAFSRAVEESAAVAFGRPRAERRRTADRRARTRDHRLPLGTLFPRRGAVLRSQRPRKTIFKAELPSRFETQAEAEAFLRSCIGATFTVSKAEEKPAQRFPAPPFTTSTLQQEAGRKLGMSVSQTMSVAQHLYEQGLITYMRTDSVNLSQQALTQCKEEITKLYGENIRRGITIRPRPREPRRRTRPSARRISTASRSKAPRPKRNSTT